MQSTTVKRDAPERALPPKPAWPSLAAQLQQVRALGISRVQDAFDRHQQVHHAAKQLAIVAAKEPLWPAEPALLHPDMQASNLRRAQQQAQASAHKRSQADSLWQAYRAMEAQNTELLALFERHKPPPRIVHLVGGIDAYGALPDVSCLPTLSGALISGLPYPVARGQSPQGCLFVAVTYLRRPPDSDAPLTPPRAGIVVLRQAGPDPASAWTMSNPQKFMPQGMPMGGLCAPHFPNMSGRGALVGNLQAQAMFTALCELVHQGSLGPYRLAAVPMPSASNAL